MEKEIRPLWELLILSRDQEKPAALNCEECMLLMVYDADLLSAGASQEEIIHIVKRHLSICSTCRHKFDDWLDQYSRYNSSKRQRVKKIGANDHGNKKHSNKSRHQ